MTPRHEEAERFLRLAQRDLAAFEALLKSLRVDPAVAYFHASNLLRKPSKRSCIYATSNFGARMIWRHSEACSLMQEFVLPVDGFDLRRLTPYAVEFLYDDEVIDLISGEEAGWLATRLPDSSAAEIGCTAK